MAVQPPPSQHGLCSNVVSTQQTPRACVAVNVLLQKLTQSSWPHSSRWVQLICWKRRPPSNNGQESVYQKRAKFNFLLQFDSFRMITTQTHVWRSDQSCRQTKRSSDGKARPQPPLICDFCQSSGRFQAFCGGVPSVESPDREHPTRRSRFACITSLRQYHLKVSYFILEISFFSFWILI